MRQPTKSQLEEYGLTTDNWNEIVLVCRLLSTETPAKI